MHLDSDTNWIIAICFGAMMVGVYSWSRFDEPSYDSQSEYFARYKPRFATSYARYARAKWGYVCAIVLVYLIFSAVPELFAAFAGFDAGQPKSIEGSLPPLAIALGFITLQNAPGLKDLERRIRGSLHSFARVPEYVRRTVAQMRSSPINFNSNAVVSQTRKLGIQNSGNVQPQPALSALIAEDDVIHTWYSIGCVLWMLSERSRGQSGIDPLFFDYYKDELDNITAKHHALADLVRAHATECMQSTPSSTFADAANSNDTAVYREVRDLRDRLYTFVACGVHSSVRSDAESLEILRRLGFAVTPTHVGQDQLILQLAGLAFMALMILSIFTGYSTQIFREYVLLPIGNVWIGAFPMPTETLGYFAWSWSTAAFYSAAIFGALMIRSARVAKREWFDINNLGRERPVLRYITPTLVGTALGCVTLLIIALIGGPAFKPSFSEASKAMGEALRQTLPWYPLAMVMALIAVVMSDNRSTESKFWQSAIGRAAIGASAMALVGFLTSQLSVSNGIASFAASHQLQVSGQVTRTGIYVSLFIAAQIGVFVLVLCTLVQVSERYTAKGGRFAGQTIEAVTRQGPEFCVLFADAGAAYLFAPAHGGVDTAPALCRGQWQEFPEGTAVRWTIESGGSSCKGGNFGLICSYGNSFIYEGYSDRFSGTAEFVAQVRVRSEASGVVRQLRPATPPTSGTPPLQTRPIGMEPALPAQQVG